MAAANIARIALTALPTACELPVSVALGVCSIVSMFGVVERAIFRVGNCKRMLVYYFFVKSQALPKAQSN